MFIRNIAWRFLYPCLLPVGFQANPSCLLPSAYSLFQTSCLTCVCIFLEFNSSKDASGHLLAKHLEAFIQLKERKSQICSTWASCPIMNEPWESIDHPLKGCWPPTSDRQAQMIYHGLPLSSRKILRRQPHRRKETFTLPGTEPTWTRMATFGS